MNNRDITQEIISRMSMLSHAFKVLAGTAFTGLITCYNSINTAIGFIALIILFGIMDLYYFYMEIYYRFNINDNNIPKVKFDINCVRRLFISFSVWFYYTFIIVAIPIYILFFK